MSTLNEQGYPIAIGDKFPGILTTGDVYEFKLERPMKNWALQVYGVGGTPTSWEATLLGGFDADKLESVLTHISGTQTDGAIASVADLPFFYYKLNVGALVLGPATSITVVLMAV